MSTPFKFRDDGSGEEDYTRYNLFTVALQFGIWDVEKFANQISYRTLDDWHAYFAVRAERAEEEARRAQGD